MTAETLPASQPWQGVRVVLAVALFVIALATVVGALFVRGSFTQTSVESRSLNDATIQAIDLRVQESTTIYQLSVAFIAALWGLVLSHRAGPSISAADPEALLVVASTIMLGAALTWHYLYVGALFDAYRVAGSAGAGSGLVMPDVFRPQFEHLLTFQRTFFVGGFIFAIATLGSARLTRLSPPLSRPSGSGRW